MSTACVSERSEVRSLLRVFADGETQAWVCVFGSRFYPRMWMVKERVRKLRAHFGDGLVLVTGTEPGARKDRSGRVLMGVDETAASEAERLDVRSMICEPDWDFYGKAAGPRRNQAMVDLSDHAVGFWDLKSRGTAHTILMAAEAGILRSVFGPKGELIEPEDAVALAMNVVE